MDPNTRPFQPVIPRFLVAILSLLLAGMTGCSLKKMAINQMGDALASSGTTFASDNDPELIRDAVPFTLKLMESLLAESPNHEGLLLALSSGFAQYAFAFVQQDADFMEDEDFSASALKRERARKLYLRAKSYGMRGLELNHPGIEDALNKEGRAALSSLRTEDTPMLYWTAVSWAAAIAASKDNPFLVAQIPQMEALIDRALELDASWEYGAIHEFLIAYEMNRQGSATDLNVRIRNHFEKARELSKDRLIGPLVAYAEVVSVQEQNLAEFERLLEKALNFNVDEYPQFRLVNIIMQRRAQWLLSKKEDLFIIDEN